MLADLAEVAVAAAVRRIIAEAIIVSKRQK
jgi:hypothetical protein